MAGRYTGSYLDRPNGWRAVRPWPTSAKLHSSDASPKMSNMTLPAWRQLGSVE